MVEKIIHLNALDLDVFVPENVNFYDDGVVGDIDAHKSFLIWKYGGNLSVDLEQSRNPRIKTVGRLGQFTDAYSKVNYFHIFYLKSAPSVIGTRGHEETHFLHAVKRLNVLQQKILYGHGVEIDFERIRNSIADRYTRREMIAEVGSIFCQHQRDGWLSVLNLYNGHSSRSEEFNDAFKIYSNAMEESLKKSKKS